MSEESERQRCYDIIKDARDFYKSQRPKYAKKQQMLLMLSALEKVLVTLQERIDSGWQPKNRQDFNLDEMAKAEEIIEGLSK